MNVNEFHKQLADAPLSFRRRLRDYLRHPTERNVCYITGYIAALEDARLFKTDDAARYWLALIGRTEGNGALGCEPIAEMNNPPAGDAQTAEIEVPRAGVERDKALLRQVLDALEGMEKWASSIYDGYPPSTASIAAAPYREAARAAIAKATGEVK